MNEMFQIYKNEQDRLLKDTVGVRYNFLYYLIKNYY